MRRSFSTLPTILALAALALIIACDGEPAADAPPAETARAVSVVEGDCGDVYGASVCTWAKLEGDRVVEVGATIPIESIANAPADAPFVFPPVEAATIAMPAVVQERTGLLDLKVYWEAQGHPPAPYLTPHFDFHVYMRPRAEINAIDCSDHTKPAALPGDYELPDMEVPELGTLVGTCVPAMGMHALPGSELASEEIFGGTMVLGYYSGDPIFMEPMISQDLLMQRADFSLETPGMAGVDAGVILPTAFDAVWDDAAGAYDFVFSGFPTN